MTDIDNAYLHARRKEVYSIAGHKVGDDEGHFLPIVRACYGLKSSGTAWHSHFANFLYDCSFLPNHADPDVWHLQACKTDSSD